MCEAKDGVVILDDIDEQTFARFCEYAYMGDYAPPQNKFSMASKDGKTRLPPVQNVEFATLRSKTRKKSKLSPKYEEPKYEEPKYDEPKYDEPKYDKPKYEDPDVEQRCEYCSPKTKQILWDEFQRRDYSDISPRFRLRGSFEECKVDSSLFLCHARVYVFADKYDITQLRNLALDKLHQALRSLKAAGSQTESVVDLIRYSYSNDNTRDNDAGQEVDGLRRMVVHFLACVFENVAMDDSFLALMEEGGPLVRDLAGLLAKRITC
jgi:hypothetical protein